MSKEKKPAGKAPVIVVSVLLVVALIVNVVCIQLFSAINTFMAANLNSRLPGAHGSVTAEQLTPEQAKEAAQAMAQELAAEGIVLLENKNAALPLVNCTPFVRQYGILSKKWGALLCQKGYQTKDTQQSSRKWS